MKHLVLCRLEGRPPRLDLELYPYLPRVRVNTAVGESGMNDRSTLLLEHHLKELKLPSFFREYGKMAAQCAAEGVDHPQILAAAGRAGTHRPPPAHGGAGGSGRPGSLPSKAWTPSTLPPSRL